MNTGDVRLVVVGTGTGVGKTHVVCALLHAWKARGRVAVGLKPIESGVPRQATDGLDPSDQSKLWRASQGFHVKRGEHSEFHVKRSLYAFEAPLSPHLAARIAGQSIDLAAVRRWVDASSASVTIVETAGGLFSPLSSTATNLDLVSSMGADAALLVAPDRLGVLHDVTAALGLAAARGVRIAAVALSAPETADASTGRNAEELTLLRIAEPLTVFPRAAADSSASIAAAESVVRFLDAAISRGDLQIRP